MRHRTLVLALVALAFCGLAVAEEAVVEVAGEYAAGFFDKAQRAEQELFVHRWLTAQQAAAKSTSAIEIELTAAEHQRLSEAQPGERRVEVGLVKNVRVPFKGRSVGAKSSDGLVWSRTARSAGATALRLQFVGFSLPVGLELYVYSSEGQVEGPYTGMGPQGTGAFWTRSVFGEAVTLQLHQRVADVEQSQAHFLLRRVAHIGPKFLMGVMQNADPALKSFCSFNEPCIENASCSSIPSAVADARDAVAHILFRSGGSFFICSGGLLADTDSSTQVPHFLTANHCISKNREASSMEAFFQFSTNCNGACFDPDGAVPSTLGASIQSTSRGTDHTLMLLDQNAPAGSFFMGWNATPVAFADGTSLFRISHPAGSPQAYSEQDVDASAGTCGGLPRGDFIYSRDTFGGTEGGSSGAPVVNGSGQVVGQLFGACGTNVDDACDFASNATVDGAFASYFSSVQPFLDPQGGGCTDNDNDGFCSGDDCDDNDAGVNPGAAEVCDGVDNDCDGSVDEGCGMCLPKTSACSANSDCCSNKCRGPSGNRTCK